ncbi:MAG: amidohydrolase family protein [Bacteroidia bacterium]|nr:amidohydrolase family protein [Bacteroidia bacterium]
MKKFTADLIYTMNGDPLKDHVVITDNTGLILSIERLSDHDVSSVRHLGDALIPGFINAHCHLELSHMKGIVPSGTGLIPFITDVVTRRDKIEKNIHQAILDAEQEMIRGGIVAVGDISNTTDTFELKTKGNLRYYTFVEHFDFLQHDNAQAVLDQYDKIFQALSPPTGNRKAKVPHAPYTVSSELFKLLYPEDDANLTISIHNQEMIPENQLFESKTGELTYFYRNFGIPLDNFQSTGKTSIHWALPRMNPKMRTILVHNTICSAEDIAYAHSWSDQVYWATCPNANLYIENRLPNYKLFIEASAKMTIGTDSLTSNWQLSILEEMKTILKYASYLSFENVLKWSTINGARALGFENELGSIEVDKRPGLVSLDFKRRQHFSEITTATPVY